MEHTNKLLVICGPTATGKTNLALKIARECNGEVISADSRQVYRGMDIGTGKDAKNILMYDVVNPNEEFSVSHYVRLSTTIIQEVHSKGKLPILVGGTGFYIKAITEGIETIDIPRNERLRNELQDKSVQELQQILHDRSAEMFESMNNSDRNNSRRLIRKIEILKHQSPKHRNSEQIYNSLMIGLTATKDMLETKIRDRVMHRIERGIVNEIKGLLQKGYSWDLPAMNTFGYKEWKEYVKQPTEKNKQLAIEDWIKDEIEYAKKQMVWFNKQKSVEWFDIDHHDMLEQIREKIRLWYN